MNLNLVPQQLPSIILASTTNSSPASHFSPLKKPFFLSLQRWNCLACLPGKWFLSRLVTLVLSTVCVCGCIQGLSYICVSKCMFLCVSLDCIKIYKSVSKGNVFARKYLGMERSTFSQCHQFQNPCWGGKKRMSGYKTEIYYNYFASKNTILLYSKHLGIALSFLSLSDSDMICLSKDCMLHTTDMSEPVSMVR